MRALAPLFVASLALLASAVSCDDSDPSAPLIPAVDGGVLLDGSAVVVDDAAVPPVIPTVGVTVNVRAFGEPIADAVVYIHDAAGATIDTQKTDANGRFYRATAPAQLTVKIGTTLIDPNSQDLGGALVTYTSLDEGDLLNIDATPQAGQLANAVRREGKWSVTPPLPILDGTYVELTTGVDCAGGGGFPTMDLELQAQCTAPQDNAVVARLRSVDGVTTLGYSWKKGLPRTARGQTEAITLTEPWSSGHLFKMQARNVPAFGSAEGAFVLVDNGRSFYVDANAVDTGTLEGLGRTTPVPPAAFAPSIQGTVYAAFDKNLGSRSAVGSTVRQPVSSDLVVDLATALPRITTVTMGASATPHPTARWTTAAPLTGATAGSLRFGLQRLNGGDSGFGYGWTVVLPPSATSVDVPTLPPGALDGTDDGVLVPELVFTETALVGGYKAAKSVPVTAARRTHGHDITTPLPADGTVRFTAFGVAPIGYALPNWP